MRRRRMDHEYRDRRDEIRIERASAERRQVRYRENPPAKPKRRAENESRRDMPQRNPNGKNGKNGKRNQRRRQIERRRRRQSVGIVLGLILFLVAVYGSAKLYVKVKGWEGKAEQSDFVVTAAGPKKIEDEVINVAILGTDEDGFRADVDMVASFNTNTKKLSLIGVPRDTRVTMTTEMTSFLEQNGRTVPERNGVYGQCKLTEVHAYAGEGNRCTFSVAAMENLLNIEIDYYIKVDLSAFRDIVDAVGGVDFNVQDRLYYVDPFQDLYIDLYPGEQHLDGKKAEQLVRFREGYAQRDLKRIQVQQDFMQALLAKVCSTDSLLKNINGLIEVALEKSESNITLTEALQYVKYIKYIDPAAMEMVTIPGEGGGFFDMDEEGTKELIDRLVYGIEPEETVQTTMGEIDAE